MAHASSATVEGSSRVMVCVCVSSFVLGKAGSSMRIWHSPLQITFTVELQSHIHLGKFCLLVLGFDKTVLIEIVALSRDACMTLQVQTY